METLFDLDKSLFVFLNSLGSKPFDLLWLIVTNKTSSFPLYIFLLIYLFKKTESKNFNLTILFIALLILFTDQMSNFFKIYFERLRPCHNEDLNTYIRIVKEGCGGLYGFFSAHAANSFAIATFFYFKLNKYSKHFKYLFIWALIVSYSRIYVGVHYPIDIIFGIFFGIFSGYVFYSFLSIINKKIK
mgnify:FL=1